MKDDAVTQVTCNLFNAVCTSFMMDDFSGQKLRSFMLMFENLNGSTLSDGPVARKFAEAIAIQRAVRDEMGK